MKTLGFSQDFHNPLGLSHGFCETPRAFANPLAFSQMPRVIQGFHNPPCFYEALRFSGSLYMAPNVFTKSLGLSQVFHDTLGFP